MVSFSERCSFDYIALNDSVYALDLLLVLEAADFVFDVLLKSISLQRILMKFRNGFVIIEWFTAPHIAPCNFVNCIAEG
jgi:hypothetical protein